MAIKAVLFDLDGTLVNSAPDLIAALQALREHLDLGALPDRPWATLVSQGGKVMVEQALSDQKPDLDFERAMEVFLAHYEANLFRQSHLYPGISALLDVLTEDKIKLGVVTNKRFELATQVLHAAGIEGHFGAVIGGDSLAWAKPHPAPVLAACQQLGVAVEQACLVGDDQRDVDAALASGTSALIAGWGYGAGAMASTHKNGSLWCDTVEHLRDTLVHMCAA